ncbi:hypothetical protein LWI29_036667 [Acer saccharum]|uniref:Oberon-like PHD finger domain-containing protein n=1 Tax=Acer saccharum TaxID=4024 RepID=A0AA39W9L5_ACESA|nr:hypothetical protein LWI29_036667 [Acer saccharum]
MFHAGTIGGSIGLDAEYCCRRCDAKTDLILHATRLVRTCKSVDCQDDIEKILKVGVCILRGSQKTSAKELLSHIELAIKKKLAEAITRTEDEILLSEARKSQMGLKKEMQPCLRRPETDAFLT